MTHALALIAVAALGLLAGVCFEWWWLTVHRDRVQNADQHAAWLNDPGKTADSFTRPLTRGPETSREHDAHDESSER